MKRAFSQILIVVLIISIAIPIIGTATETRAMTIIPGLSFSGTTANCEVTVACDYTTDKISATMKLWEGNFCIATWTASGSGSLSMEKTKSNCTEGQEYTVTVDVVINGVSKPRVHIKRTC